VKAFAKPSLPPPALLPPDQHLAPGTKRSQKVSVPTNIDGLQSERVAIDVDR